MFLALKEMTKDKGRFLLIISIVVLISYLVFFLTGLAYGLARDNTTAVDHWGASYIALKAGTNANILSSMMETDVLENFEGDDFSPVNIGRSVGYLNGSESKEDTIDLVLIGLHQDSKAYPELLEGELPSTQNEVLASITLQEEDGVQLGDEIVLSMNDQHFVVTGFTEESKFNVSSVIYTDLEMASATMLSFIDSQSETDTPPEDPEEVPIDGDLEYPVDETSEAPAETDEALVEGEGPPTEVDTTSYATRGVPQRIAGILIHGEPVQESDDQFDIIPMDAFIQELPGYIAQVLTFGLMIGFLILISAIVLGVFIYIITMQKKQTFGIMKVQGISSGYIAKSVVLQTFMVSVLGVAIGLGLTYLTEYVLPYTVPFRSNIIFYGIIAFIFVIISLLGAVFSVVGVSKVDPLDVLD